MDRSPRLLLGVTGGIAAYKVPQLVRLLRKGGAEVTVVLTAGARGLVGEEALRVVSGNPVYRDGAPPVHDMDHIRLAEWADRYAICPATANTIAKLACGIADNLVTTLALGFENRLAVVPAMNTAMWNNAATQRNLATLRERGVQVLPVEEGELACGTSGPGRMLAVEAVADALLAPRAPVLLAGKRVLIASGPTEEPLDPVRVITNRSSGRMGAALAAAARDMGAEVTVVSGPAAVPPPCGVRAVSVRTALEMQQALEAEFDRCHICIMAAAVSDYRPERVAAGKIHRDDQAELTLKLVPNPDIAAGLGARKEGRFLVGFALESDESGAEERARQKLVRKHLDMVVLNHVNSSLGLDSARVTIVFSTGQSESLAAMDKAAVAREILARVASQTGSH
jgi:phosphopantothenoylcysteine decarboxylase / phosphopantothenate---cysteine ligase